MYCRNCGKLLDDNTIFCPFCGTKISVDLPNIPQNPQSSIEVVKDIYSSAPVRPWIRYFARMLDIYLYTVIVGYLSALILGFLLSLTHVKLYGVFYNFILNHEKMYHYIVFLTYMFVEAFLLSKTGMTFGKFIFKTKVKSALTQTNLTYKQALNRAVHVFISGLGLGIPIVCFFTMGNSHTILKRTGTTSWDKENHSIVLHSKQSPMRILVGISAIAIIHYTIISIIK